MAWGRLALVQAAGEFDDALPNIVKLFGYRLEAQQREKIDESGDANTNVTGDTAEQDVAANSSQRPAARFLRVNRRIPLEKNGNDKPSYLSDKSIRLQAKPGSYSFVVPEPLMPMSRLLPFLHNSLGQARAAGKLDHKRLSKCLAEAKAIRRLPYKQRQCWPQRLQILVDTSLGLEPYWPDFAYIAGRLQKLLGAEAVSVLRLDEDTLGEEQSFCIPWPTQNHHQWSLWRLQPETTAVLILSDLGVTQTHPASRIRWQRLLKRLHAHPAPLLALSPADKAPDNPALCRLVKPNPLNDGYNLPRHPKRNGFSLSEPEAETISKLLALLSYLPVVDSGLLRRLRIELKWGGSELESQIWNHPDMRPSNFGISLRESTAEYYRGLYRQYWQGSSEANKLWHIVTNHHAKAYEGLRMLEALNRCVAENIDSEEVRDYYRKLCATANHAGAGSAQSDALLAQCRSVLAFMPKTIWQSPLNDTAYDVYGLAHADAIRAGRWPDRLEPGFDPSRLQYLIDETGKTGQVQWQLLQTGGQGQFVCRRGFGFADGSALTVEFDQARTAPPSVIFDGQSAIPPVLHGAGADGRVLNEGTALALPVGEATIETAFERLELEVVTKPSWASSIRQNGNGLYAEIPWLGSEQTVPWQTGDGDSAGHWLWPAPFGQDVYGLYADLTVNNVIQRFRWIDPGRFMMGSPASEVERVNNELQHEVILTKGYWLADTACTQELWKAVTGNNPSRFIYDTNNPVEKVSWNDVQDFIERLNRIVPGLTARLPSESEWEYACRAGTTTPFSFGTNITPEQVNYHGGFPYADAERGLFREKTIPVKSLLANSWGLHEMHGNVWEWCQDGYGEYGSEVAINPTCVVDNGSGRVLRGGSWFDDSEYTRSAYRSWDIPAYLDFRIGFRLALG